MDAIQKILIKAGHKDLAQKYYKKIAKTPKYMIIDNQMEKFIGKRNLKEPDMKKVPEKVLQYKSQLGIKWNIYLYDKIVDSDKFGKKFGVLVSIF